MCGASAHGKMGPQCTEEGLARSIRTTSAALPGHLRISEISYETATGIQRERGPHTFGGMGELRVVEHDGMSRVHAGTPVNRTACGERRGPALLRLHPAS